MCIIVKQIVDMQCKNVKEVLEMQSRLLSRKAPPAMRIQIDISRETFALHVLCESERQAQDVREALLEVLVN